jgi:RHS repeat-associated protein
MQWAHHCSRTILLIGMMRNPLYKVAIVVGCMMLKALLMHAPAFAANKSGVEPQVISLPKGPGSVEGLGEAFEPQLNTGTATYSVKIKVSPGVNKHQPEVVLEYNGGNGNSPLGIGWGLNTEYIQRRTDKGLPAYANSDTFTYSKSGELVPLNSGIYRLKVEGLFMKFKKTGGTWEAWEKDGTHLYFGATAESRSTNPLGTFKWFLEKSVDTNGNEIRYFYQHDVGQTYLSEIRYSIMSETVYKSVIFRYEDRPDVFTDYHSRTKITTAKRLKTIEVRSEGALVRKYVFGYKQGTDFSLLSKVTQYGKDAKSTLPPLTFDYSTYTPQSIKTVAMTDVPPTGISLLNDNVDLIDINGDALPDVIETSPVDGFHYFYINKGKGAWSGSPVMPDASPQYLLASKGVMMSDMDGDGLADLFVKNDFDFGYFKNKGNLKWEETDWVTCSPNPNFNFESQNVRLLDVNNDGLIDVMVDTGSSYHVWLNRKSNQWNTDFDYETFLPNGSYLSFISSSTKLGDMNGDRMEDLVRVLDGNVSYFPSKGNGDFDSEVEMHNEPTGIGYLAEKLSVADINNDGLSDLVLIGNSNVTVWFNIGNDTFKAPVVFEGTPTFVEGTSAFRFADLNGDGFRDLLVTDETSANRYQYIDFNNGVHPNLLAKITNGLGMETTITYKSSTEDYLADRNKGVPWVTVLPFPVQVVGRVDVKDNNSGAVYTTEYAYRDGYYDGIEKEFRGFGGLRKISYGETTAPTLVTNYVFDVGKTEKSRKGMVKSVAALRENGTVNPPTGLFDKEDNTITTRSLFAGTNGERVKYSFTSAKKVSIYENTATPKILLREFDQDNYGNATEDFNYGVIVGTDKSVGKDEILTTTTYLYDEVNWIVDRPETITKTDLAGKFVSFQKNHYEPITGNLLWQESSPDNVVLIPVVRNEYYPNGNIKKITDADDHYREIGYDPVFKTFPVSETIGGLGLSMQAGYDYGLGVVTSFTDFNGNNTSFNYDVFGRLKKIVKPGDTLAVPTQEFIYTLSNPVSSVMTKSREVSGEAGTYDTITYYDGLGRKLQTKSEGETNNWVVSDAVSFNKQKGIKKKWLPYFSLNMEYEVLVAARPAVSYQYDAKGRSVKEVNPDSSFRSTKYQPLKKIVYDEEDNLQGGLHYNTPHTFINDGLDRLVEVDEKNGTVTYKTLYEYDGLNNLTKIIDNENNIKTMLFDGLGRKREMDDPDKHHMSYDYYAAGNLKTTTDAKKQTVNYTYDEANRIKTEEFNGVIVRYHYDTDLPLNYPNLQNTKGKLTFVEDEAGKEYYSYDSRGNTIAKIRKAGGFTFINRMVYDAMDRLTTFTYPDGFAINYFYNSMNQLDSIPGFVADIDYIATGQKSTFDYANGVKSGYFYDNRQRLENLKTSKGTSILQDLTYGYDKVSDITGITDNRSVKTTEDQTRNFIYDDLYRLTDATATAWTESYQYSSIGNMTFKSDIGTMSYGENGAGPHALTKAAGAGINYTYDDNGNIKSKQPGFTYQFDHKDRLASAKRLADGADISYSYDYKGNRVTKTVTIQESASVSFSGLTGESRNTVDALLQSSGMTEEPNTAGFANKSLASSQTTIYADKFTEVRGDKLIKNIFAADRLVARIYAPFDASRLMTRIAPLTAEDFDQDPKDGIISLTEIREQGIDPSKVETKDAADGLRIYYESLEANPNLLSFGTMAKAMHELGAAQQAVGTVYFYLPDHLGSPNIVTDKDGNIVEESAFYPYGAERTRKGTFDSEYRFTGKELDDETGLHYFGARYYDSQSVRFVSVDPLYVEAGVDFLKDKNRLLTSISFNTFAYCKENPLNCVDIFGLDTLTIYTTSSHSWIERKDDNGKITTYGTYQENAGSNGGEQGLRENEELNNHDAYYNDPSLTSRSLEINGEQVEKFDEKINEYKKMGNDAWGIGHPCSSFAVDTWNYTTNEKLDRNVAHHTPFSVALSIYETKGYINNNGYIEKIEYGIGKNLGGIVFLQDR